ncbi:UvrD-helicase domain-containing protein [Oscillochloris sp. ZM17-4]|uniref:ATP-dependent helicase n=1 Tax=Oscillochloris sp. ZM17-4 TaxID=2866714 RepID=UPI001C72D761|nr:UvrD-helicase domain-containing protein [Oscillochloris sp. ZM17-4]MBX0327666.1 UvrD-helicase domain-containing protein [Oscillochloris sp. ZM17-4]
MADELFSGLNPAQRRAVEAVDGPVLVLAGPGSGKTRVLTHRIAYLIREVGVDPFSILAVTFTNKAAREMRERLDVLIGSDAQALTAGTFHSLCARFLRRDIIHLGRERDFAIYDSDDQERLMRRVLKELNLDEKKNPPRAIHARISSAKNELVSPAEYARLNRTYFDEIVVRCYERYQQLLRESNALDFDDLLVEMVHVFQQHPEVLARYQNRYAYLLVDEYQDTNRVQYTLIKMLAGERRNLFAVGDDDQSVYGWRGADIRNILQFEQDYPDSQVILLEQNYRSTQAILDTAQALIAGGGKKKHLKKLWTENGAGTQVSLHEGYDQSEEASFVADEISRLVAGGDYSYGDFAVMYRINAQSRALEEALIGRGVRYVIVGGTRFYERKEIKDVLAYVRLAYNPYDSVSLGRVLNWPGRGIGDRSEAELLRWAAELGVPVFEALRELEDLDRKGAAAPADQAGLKAPSAAAPLPFTLRVRNSLLGFLAIIDQFIAARATMPLVELIDLILGRLDVRETLLKEHGPDEAEDRWSNVQELRNVAAEYVNMPLEAQLPTYLEEIALVAEVDKVDGKADAVTCITLHQAKGLEYPVVFLVGLEEGLLPHSRSSDDRDKVEEERRLLYVGMTRARQRLYLCYAFRRVSYGRTSMSTVTRFLSDIPKELIRQPKKRGAASPQASMFTGRGGYGGSSPRGPSPSPSAGTRPQRAPAPTEVSFFAGQRVRHATFGEGVVMSSRLVEGDEEVTVSFADKERRLLASFARLEKV